MKIKLCYPTFSFYENDNMVYVVNSDINVTTRAILKEINYFKGKVVVDSCGMKYIVKEAYEVRKLGLLDFLKGKGRGIIIEYDYEENPTKISVDDLKKMILERYPKSRWFYEAWADDIEKFEDEINQCETFKHLAILLG